MAGMSHLQALEPFVRWTARVWGTLVLAFVLLFLLADVFAPGSSAGFVNPREALTFAFFPLARIAHRFDV